MQNLADQSAMPRFYVQSGSTGKGREKDFLKSAGTVQGWVRLCSLGKISDYSDSLVYPTH